MATETTNYKFIKDAPNEYYDVAKVNDNLDKIDEAIEGALDKANQAFQSASDGKQVIATAITGKGVPTSSSDTFQKMATNIDAIETDKTGDATATAADILAPKDAYVKGQKIKGTIPSKAAATITPTTSPQIIAANQYLSGAQTIAGVVVPVANVLAGVTIAGAVGTMPNRGALNQTITSNNGQVNIASGYYTGGVIKAIFANLIESNVRAGVNIGGVIGNLVESPIKASSKFISSDGTSTTSNVVGTKFKCDGVWPANATFALITNSFSGQGQGTLGTCIAIRGGVGVSQPMMSHVPAITILTNTTASLVVESEVYFKGGVNIANLLSVQYFS